MGTDPASAASLIFAANRAQGSVTFDVQQVEGVTRRRQLHESGSLRGRFPSPEAQGLSAVFVNTSCGTAGGARCGIDKSVRAGGRLTPPTPPSANTCPPPAPAPAPRTTIAATATH